MKINKLEIGKIYTFDYESTKTYKPMVNPVKIDLSDRFKNKIVSRLQVTAQKAEKRFQKRRADLIDHVSLIKTHIKVSERRKADGLKKRTEEEIDLAEQIEESKEKYFPKFKNFRRKVRAMDLFFKQYNLDSIDFNDNGKIKAVLANKKITSNGLEVVIFVKLTGTTAEWAKVENLLKADSKKLMVS